MSSQITNKKCKIIIIDTSGPVRQMLSETMRQAFGYENVESMASVSDAIEYLQVERADWILTPLMVDQPANGLHLLKIVSEFPELKNIRVSLFIEPEEAYVLPAAFEFGLFSWHKKPTIKDALKEEITGLQAILKENSDNEPVTAAWYLSKYLSENKRFDEQIKLYKSLLKIFPGNGRVLMQMADPYIKTSQASRARRVLSQAKLVDPALADKADEMIQGLLKNNENEPDTPAPEEDSVLAIENCVVIDGDSVIGQGVSDLLKPLGLKNVTHFQDGESAWSHFESNPEPQLIIMEWRIPKLSGPLLIQRIRSHGFLNVPIIILSSLLKPDDMPLIREMGAANIVQKPLNTDLFVPACIWTIQQDRAPTEHQSMERKIRHLLAAHKIEEAEPLIAKFLGEQTTPPAKKRLIEAESAYAKGDFNHARDAAVESLKLAGDSVLVLNLLGKTFMRLSNFEAAIKCFNKAQEISPDNIERLCNIAEAHTDLGNTEEAQKALGDAGTLDPDAKTVADSQIKVAISSGDTEAAKKMMSELESLDSLVAYMNNKAVAFARTGGTVEAVDLYKKTINSIPDDRHETKAIVLYNLALAQIRDSEIESAAAKLSQVLQMPKTKITAKATSLKERLDKALKDGSEFKLKSEGGTATGAAAAPGSKTNAENPSAPALTTEDYRQILASVVAKQGDLCCFMVFSPTEARDARSVALLAKAPRFQLRSAIAREESMGAERVAKESA
jgi:tetratricopeptide (TPR) repeat protein